VIEKDKEKRLIQIKRRLSGSVKVAMMRTRGRERLVPSRERERETTSKQPYA
jgi:hypothetical protein